MPDDIKKKIDKVAAQRDKFLNSSIDNHQRRMTEAITNLEKNIINQLKEFETTDGQLVGPKVNMKQAQKLHTKLKKMFDETYGEAAREVVDGFDRVAKHIQKEFKEFDVAGDFTSADKDMVETLKNSSWGTFNQFGLQAQEQMVDKMYNSILSKGSFAALVTDFQGILSGHKDARGRPMSLYANLYANDAVMNFQNAVHLKKADDLGMEYFLYYGNLMNTSRDFCIKNVGKVFSREAIDNMTYNWQGKSGPAFTNRGGYNCRHHWVAVRKDWVEGKYDIVETAEDMAGVKPTQIYPSSFDAAQAKLADPDGMFPHIASNKYDSPEEFFAKVFKGSPAEVRKRLQTAIDNSDIYMAIDPKLFRREIVRKPGGKFKNSLETKKGTFKTIGEERAKKERWMFGIDAELDDFDNWPKYGFLSSAETMANENIVSFGYGDSFIKFKKANLVDRTTFTIGDSFNGNVRRIAENEAEQYLRVAPPSKLTHVNENSLWTYNTMPKNAPILESLADAATIDEFVIATEYPEAQIYGKLTMDDVDEIFVTSRKEAGALAKDLKKAGYDNIKISPCQYDERLKDLWERSYSNKAMTFKYSLTPDDIDRLGDPWLMKLEVPEQMAAVYKNSRRLGHKPWTPPDSLKDLFAKYMDNGSLTMRDRRELTKEFFRLVPEGEAGGLHKVMYDDFRKTRANWTEDVFNEDLLKNGYR